MEITAIFHLLFAPTVWALHLAIIYIVQSTVCAFGASAPAVFGVDLVLLTVVIATAIALALVAASIWGLLPAMRRVRSADRGAATRFFERTAKLLGLLAVIGILWGGATVFVLHPCAALR